MKIVARAAQKENVSIRDAAAHGCDTFVDCITMTCST
jgi:hypothetical protein